MCTGGRGGKGIVHLILNDSRPDTGWVIVRLVESGYKMHVQIHHHLRPWLHSRAIAKSFEPGLHA